MVGFFSMKLLYANEDDDDKLAIFSFGYSFAK